MHGHVLLAPKTFSPRTPLPRRGKADCNWEERRGDEQHKAPFLLAESGTPRGPQHPACSPAPQGLDPLGDLHAVMHAVSGATAGPGAIFPGTDGPGDELQTVLEWGDLGLCLCWVPGRTPLAHTQLQGAARGG